MKTVRGKLFLHLSVLLLIMATLSYFIPNYFVVKDTSAASKHILAQFDQMQAEFNKRLALWVGSYFVEKASQLDTVAKILETHPPTLAEQESLTEIAIRLITYDPNLAFVQITDSKQTVAIAPENAQLHVPTWMPLEEGKLVLRFPEQPTTFYTATPLASAKGYYTLERSSESFPTAGFTSFKALKPLSEAVSSTEEIYHLINAEEDLLLAKTHLIVLLGSHLDSAGILWADPKKNEGYAIFNNELFLPPLDLINERELFLFPRGTKLDLIRPLHVDPFTIYLGLSVEKMGQDIVMLLQEPFALSMPEGLTLLFRPNKSTETLADASALHAPEMTIDGTAYVPNSFKLGPMEATFLTPSTVAHFVSVQMNQLGRALERKISFNLLTIALFVLAVGLLLLGRMSKRLTQPIAQLAVIAKQIGEGHYEEVSLPDIKNQENEMATLTRAFDDMVVALREREKMRGALNKVVSPEIASAILKSTIQLGGEEREITLLFSDIRHFTQISNTLSPQEVIEMLNDYMTCMCEQIDAMHGVVDKFVGDEIMALFGAPLELPQHADKALETAVRMMGALREWNAKRGSKPRLEMGIGLHTGRVCSGNMGAINRLNYTVIGANVNLASRLCSVAKPMQILLSKETKLALKNPEKYPLKEIAPLSLKGFEHPMEAFEVLTA